MKDWAVHINGMGKVSLKDKRVEYIVNEIADCLPQFWSYKALKRPQTTLIKDALSRLGRKRLKGKPVYKVYSNGISPHLRQKNGGPFKNVEFLFDLHWYTERGDYEMTGLPLVVECEWHSLRRGDRKKIPFGGIKYDFQKLLVANADLRLMIFALKKYSDIEKLDVYFERAIASYKNLEDKAKFIFIAFDKSISGFHYVEKTK